MKKSITFALLMCCFTALFAQNTASRFSAAFRLSEGFRQYANFLPYEYSDQWTQRLSLDAGYRFWWKLHFASGWCYETRTYYYKPGLRIDDQKEHFLKMLGLPTGVQMRWPLWYLGAGVQYSMLVCQKHETRPYEFDFPDDVIGDFPYPLPEEYRAYVDKFRTWGYWFELGFTPPLSAGFRALLEARYAGDFTKMTYSVPLQRGFSGSIGLLYNFN